MGLKFVFLVTTVTHIRSHLRSVFHQLSPPRPSTTNLPLSSFGDTHFELTVVREEPTTNVPTVTLQHSPVTRLALNSCYGHQGKPSANAHGYCRGASFVLRETGGDLRTLILWTTDAPSSTIYRYRGDNPLISLTRDGSLMDKRRDTDLRETRIGPSLVVLYSAFAYQDSLLPFSSYSGYSGSIICSKLIADKNV